MTDIIIGPGDSPTAMVVNADGSINVNTGGGGGNDVNIISPVTAAGSANPVSVLILDSSGNPLIYTGATTVQGAAPSLATASGNPLQAGLRASVSATAPTAATDGQIIYAMGTDTGKTVTKPYAVKEADVRGTVTATGTGANTVLAAGSGSNKTYVTGLQVGRTDAGTSPIIVTCNDSASSVFVVPAGGATNLHFATPLVTAAATAFTVTSGTGVTTLYMSAQGYYGL